MTRVAAVTRSQTARATLPPEGLPGLDPAWSRLVRVPGRGVDEGVTRGWHCLDTAASLEELGAEPVGTILAVHGNPTWSYLWRALAAATLSAAAEGRPAWRLIAVDQLEMGFSERTGLHRPLAQRVADLTGFADAVVGEGPVVTLGHDWGGVVSLGWAVDHARDGRLAAIALLNTAVHHPEGVPIPAPLRLARARGVLAAATVGTTGFLDATLALATPPLASDVKAAFRAPYAAADRRGGIGGFVADIPVDESHESHAELTRIADGVAALDVPALMLWGPADPIFGDRYLDDLVDRLPHADVHRFEGAGHLLAEERPYAAALVDWLAAFPTEERDAAASPDEERDAAAPPAEERDAPAPPAEERDALAPPAEERAGGEDTRLEAPGGPVEERELQEPVSRDHTAASPRPARRAAAAAPAPSARRPGSASRGAPDVDAAPDGFTPLWHALDDRASDPAVAVIDMASSAEPLRVSWRQLHERVRDIAAGLTRMGVRRGDRVSLLVQPGPTLTAVVYACLRIGAVVVVADRGLGLKGLTRAVRGAQPDVIIGERLGLAAARALGWPGMRISAERLPRATARALDVERSLREVAALGAGHPLPPEPGADDTAAILFTSGSTGPAKGVVYTHGQLSALRDALRQHLDVARDTGLVTGFAPFALLGPALGTHSATPDMDVSAPRTLTATAVAAAVRAARAGIVFLSPAAVLNVVATADALTAEDRAALEQVQTFLSTGAPIGAALLRAAAELMPNATPHTPYGMTECLLVADITLEGVEAAASAPEDGVCVGTPIGAARVLVSALDAEGAATGDPSDEPDVLGEIVISAPHLKAHYDRLHLTDRAAERGTESLVALRHGERLRRAPVQGAALRHGERLRRAPAQGAALRHGERLRRAPAQGAEGERRWHRTGDIGHLDREGRLWIEGRLQHVIVTADGPIAPVGPEQQIEAVDAVRRAAVVGIGPHGLRQAVAVVEVVPPVARPGLAAPELAGAVRASTALPLVAVLAVPELPTDVRHNSKIDRSRLSAWAERTLAGEPAGAP